MSFGWINIYLSKSSGVLHVLSILHHFYIMVYAICSIIFYCLNWMHQFAIHSHFHLCASMWCKILKLCWQLWVGCTQQNLWCRKWVLHWRIPMHWEVEGSITLCLSDFKAHIIKTLILPQPANLGLSIRAWPHTGCPCRIWPQTRWIAAK